MEVVENNYKNIYYIMKHREILNILILVGSAFLLVAVLSYFNLYEGMEPGLYEGLEEEEKKETEGLEEENKETEGMEEEKKEMEGMEDEEEKKEEFNLQPPSGPVAAVGASTVLKYSTF